jgi:hypothetical protein
MTQLCSTVPLDKQCTGTTLPDHQRPCAQLPNAPVSEPHTQGDSGENVIVSVIVRKQFIQTHV